MQQINIEKLVHGGQGLGTLPEGKKALIWNVLPGETVEFMPVRKKSSYFEGVAERIVKVSTERETPRDELYLSTSPWQMMAYAAENKYKLEILNESLQRGGVEFDGKVDFKAPVDPWNYRNKMEYSFWGDDDGVHLALFNRGTHQKQIVKGSSIARPEIDETALKIVEVLNKNEIRAGDLKTVVVRCNREGECVAALFVKTEDFADLAELNSVCNGVAVYFSNPKSPASIITKELFIYGDVTLQDTLLGQPLKYDVVSFFQGNLEAYELALNDIKTAVKKDFIIDMYAGVGSIGLSVAENGLRLVEIDKNSAAMARINAAGDEDTEVIESPSEKALEYIVGGRYTSVIFDPPRAGLHAKVTEAVLEKMPGRIVYLSCNPSTFARDLQLLQAKYKIKSLSGYNFFPRTPHIEALAILEV